MDTASQLFLEKQLNNQTLKLIYSKIMNKDNKLFKNSTYCLNVHFFNIGKLAYFFTFEDIVLS